MSAAIRVHGLSKLYRRMAPGFKLRTLKSALLDRSLTEGLEADETIAALEDVSFEVERGKAFGVIGSNGSGKSTLLKVLAGMLKPTRGTVEVDGRVAALIELGAGFHPEISGRENVYINGAILGLKRKRIDRLYDAIVEFSGLAEYMEEPVKNYSSGMYVRLGFSVAIHTDPDVLLVDEVLAVGDEAFQHRCLRRIEEFLAQGNTLLLVSHSLELIEEFADEALWLEDGRKRLMGSPRRVADAYRQAVAEEEGRIHLEAKEERQLDMGAPRPTDVEEVPEPAATVEEEEPGDDEVPAEAATEEPEVEEEPLRWGSREAEITGVHLLDLQGRERYHFESGEELTFAIDVRSSRVLDDFVFGVGLFTPRGVECWGTNTHLAGYLPQRFSGKTTVKLVCPALRLGPGEYLLDVAVHARDGYPYDYQRRVLSFTITSGTRGVGIYYPEHHWAFEDTVDWKSTPD